MTKTIDNFSVFQPHGAVVIDLTSYHDEETNQRMYNSMLTFFLDEDGSTGITIMTDIHSDSDIECLRLTVAFVDKLFYSVSAIAACYSSDTGDVTKEYNLNELFPLGVDDDTSVTLSLENRVLH